MTSDIKGWNVTLMQWRSKGGWGGGAPPRAVLFGGGKIKVIPKNLERDKVFWGGEILGRGYKRAIDERKIERIQKGRQKNFGVWDKNLDGRQF